MHQVYCSICGGPIFATDHHGKWLSEAVLLTSAHKTEQGRLEVDDYAPRTLYHAGSSGMVPRHCLRLSTTPHDEPDKYPEVENVLRLEAWTHDGSIRFTMSASGEEVDTYRVDSSFLRKPGRAKGGSPLYVPVHSACLRLADHFVSGTVSTSARRPLRTVETSGISSIEKLWEVLYRRVDVGSMPRSIPEEPHRYYSGENSSSGSKDWGADGPNDHIFESDPIDIPELTAAILDNLDLFPKEINSSHLVMYGKETCCGALRDMDLECEYIHSPELWCRFVFEKKALPWLWDLDPVVMSSYKRHVYGRLLVWDWEALVRKLSQANIHEAENRILDLPPGLKNRRRIWRLLEEARAGDVEAGRHGELREAALKRKREVDDDPAPRAFPPLSYHHPPGFPPPGFMAFAGPSEPKQM